jgi:hypothetical protein
MTTYSSGPEAATEGKDAATEGVDHVRTEG